MNSPDANWAGELFRLTVTENRYLNRWAVSPQQYAFLTYPAREILYGGAAGGGKSVALLMAALQYVTVPRYHALLLRRTFADLTQPKALIPLSFEFLAGTDARYNEQKHRWTFPNGSSLTFGYMETERDKYQYQGAAYHFCGWDELTQFTETQYTYLYSRQRKIAGSYVPLRMRAATNPGGVGHQWVRDRFINPKTRKPAALFIPAKLADNTWIDQEDYAYSLSQLDHITRKQLADGDWDIRPEGNAFKSEWFRWYQKDESGKFYLLGPERKPVEISECTRFAAADIAGTEAQDHTDPDYTVIQVWDFSPNGEMILRDQWRGRLEIPDVEEKLLSLAWQHDVDFCAVEKNGIGLPVVQTGRRRGLNVVAIVAKRDKFARSQSAQIRMEAGGIYFPKGAVWIDDLTSELLSFPMDGVHDDQVDALSIAAQRANKLHELRDDRDDAHAAAVEARIEREAKQEESAEDRRWREMVMGDDDFGWDTV